MADESVTLPQDGSTVDNKPETQTDAKPWLKMIANAEKTFTFWNEKCDNIEKVYANLKKLAGEGKSGREFQMFFANLEVLKSSIYARPPQPVVVQRFKDSTKVVARKTGEVLERALISSFDKEKLHETLKHVRDNLVTCGRGVLWERYDAEYGDKTMECVRYDWVHRKDFLHEPARCWPEVGWVARRTWLTKEQGEKRFGKAWVNIKYEDANDTADDYKVDSKAAVWELWHKAMNLVIWVHADSPEVLDIAPPHLNLEGFYPCPKPAYGTCEPDSLIPVPDMMFYKDQLEEINELTARISALSESLKLIGFYPGGAEDLGSAIEAAIDIADRGENGRILIKLPGFTQFGGGGALKDSVIWLPIREVAETVTALVALRKQLIDDVYQISGISDIMRGQTEASETLGAQQLKSQYGSIRIKDRQGEMVSLADSALNIAGEIMAENFAPETLLAMSQTELPKQADILAEHQQAMMQEIAQAVQQVQAGMAQGQPPPSPEQVEQAKQAIIAKHTKEISDVITVEKVFGLLRAEKLRPFALQIATDSTIQPDENAEKKARTEFAAAFAQVTTAWGPMIQAAPESAPLAGTMIKFILAPYRAGREMDQEIDDWIEKMKEKSSQPPPPNPEAIKAEAEIKAMQQDMEIKAADLEDRKLERAAKVQAQQGEGAAKAEEAARKMQEAEAKRQDDAVKRQRELEDRQARAMDEQRKQMEAERKAEADAMTMQINLAMKRLELDIKRLEIVAKAEEAERAKAEKADKEMQDEAKETQRHERDEERKAKDGERSAKRDEAMTSALTSLQETMMQIAQAQQMLAESMSRPKTIKFNAEGRPVGIQ